MHHFVYQTTNIINNKVYIGVHSASTLDDGYLGSGHALGSAITKYGKGNFERNILSFHKTREQAFAKETQLVTEEWIKSKKNYNITVGGSGRHGPNSRSKIVSVYDDKLTFIQSFSTKVEAAEFLGTNPVYITNACKNASLGRACRVGNHYVCHDSDTPRKKDTTYLIEHNRNIAKKNIGVKRPKHSRFMKEHNHNRECNQIEYNWIHKTGSCFRGTRRQLIDAFLDHDIKNSELGVLIKGRYKSHKGWTVKPQEYPQIRKCELATTHSNHALQSFQ